MRSINLMPKIDLEMLCSVLAPEEIAIVRRLLWSTGRNRGRMRPSLPISDMSDPLSWQAIELWRCLAHQLGLTQRAPDARHPMTALAAKLRPYIQTANESEADK